MSELLTSFRPVVTSTGLAEDEIIRAEKIAQGTRTNRVHSSRFEVDQDRTRNVLIRTDLVVVNVDTL